ncbi:MAG: hypothetical protein JW789_03840 [Candidatus Aenigmarchaeota archaeon]|nr:hypothetical protein [Candidatus Aenigmarchaeota archaeon]
MLKGQLDIDIEFMGGTIIFVFFAMIFFSMLLFPIVANSSVTSRVHNSVDQLSFSNLAEAYIERDYANENGVPDFLRMSLDTNLLKSFRNFVLFEQIPSGRFIFPKYSVMSMNPDDSIGHDTYGITWTGFENTKPGDILIPVGKISLVDVHRNGSLVIIDVYDYPRCSTGTSERTGLTVYPLCSSVSEASIVDSESARDELILSVINGAFPGTVFFMRAAKDIMVSDIMQSFKGYVSATCEDSGEHNVCIRKFSDYTTATRIHVEITPGGFFWYESGD